ncbi:MAG: cytochrome c [Planctomycetaceae bacterium]
MRIDRTRPTWMVMRAIVIWLISVPAMSADSFLVPSGGSAIPDDFLREHEGWRLLRTGRFLPADFDQEVFDELHTVWEEPARSAATAADQTTRRRMAMDRYGLTPDPLDPSRPLQYVVDADGRWTMSCLACHQGAVAGRVIPGLPNASYALETLTEDVRLVKLRQRKPLGHRDYGSLLLPLGTTVGTTNAVMFGVALMRHRDADLTIVQRPPRFDLAHHDMDAPPWWHYSKKRSMYADGFAPKGHRMLMQFLLVRENGPDRFREWEDDFRHIERWIRDLRPPEWPWELNRSLAEQGRRVFVDHCAECHGGGDATVDDDSYPARVVSIDDIGTDRTRFDSLSVDDRRALVESWFGQGAEEDGEGTATRESATVGYVAPPLDGIWASAPYFHNGSVPTLWHVLHPESRPVVWTRSQEEYDRARGGLAVEELLERPPGLPPSQRRRYFDTRLPGKSAAGHVYPLAVPADKQDALLEYLKTL